MNLYYLMIKTIDQTGLKYLCKRKVCCKDPNDHLKYKGSGVLWRRILKKHPDYTISTFVLGKYDKDELFKMGMFYSHLYNVVESKDWANLILECGDGGNTSNTDGYVRYIEHVRSNGILKGKHKNTILAHNPSTGKVIRLKSDNEIPEGFIRGNLKGRLYGPRKNKMRVVNNGVNKIYIPKNDPTPEGYKDGVHYKGTTSGRIGCHDPLTLKKKYIKDEKDLPAGWVLGLPPTVGYKLISPTGIKYNSFVEAEKKENTTRYKIQQSIKKQTGWKYE